MSLIDFKNKIIFIHIPKTAGSSIEKALGAEGGRGHLTVNEMLKIVKDHTIGINLDDFFKFSIVRNPLDRLVSCYDMFVSNDMTKFNDWIYCHEDATPFKSQVAFLCDEDKNLKVDFVGKFENLQEDWIEICKRIGVDIELPHIDPSKGMLEKPYIQYYIPETEAIIREWLKDDFEFFEYA